MIAGTRFDLPELPVLQVLPQIGGQDSRPRRGGSGVEKGGDACVALGGVGM
jgi:hypothetical protein